MTVPLRRALGAATLAGLALVIWGGPAAAHAAVTSSSPVQGAHLAHAPRTVTVNFDQPVQPDHGGLVVLASDGSPVQLSSQHPRPSSLSASLPASLGSGAYVADYTVTSVDGHVVSGGIVFLVGRASATAASLRGLARPTTSNATRMDDVGQFLTYLGVLTASGLAFFAAFILGTAPEQRRIRRWASGAAALGVIGLLVTGAAQADLTGGGLGALGHVTIDRQAFGGKFGEQLAVQCIGLAVVLTSFHVRTVMARQFAAFYGLLVAAGAFVLFGHAVVSPERWLSIPADAVHAIAAAMWAGGLVGLVIVLHRRFAAVRTTEPLGGRPPPVRTLPRPSGPLGTSGGRRGVPTSTAVLERSAHVAPMVSAPDTGARPSLSETVKVVGRFSTMAGFTFAVIIVAGTLLAVAEVGSVANLFETGYGQLLLVKIGLVAILLFLAGYNRFLLLPGLLDAAASDQRSIVQQGWHRLASTVRLEAVGMVAVLTATTLLANGTPSNGASLPPPVPFHQTQAFDGGRVSLRISPNQALVNNWDVQFTDGGGTPADLAESVSIYLVLPSQNIGPIEEDMKKVGVGHFVLTDSPNPPVVGKWQIVLQVQVSEFSQPNVSFSDTVQ